MEGNTPLKRHQALVSFSKDHHFALLLIWKIKQGLAKAVSAERISDYVLSFFKEDLQQHFTEEEQLLFCKLPMDDVLRKQAETEHKNTYQLVTSIQQNPDDIGLLQQFADTLEKHIRFEERTLFNHLQDKIGMEELENILQLSEKREHDLMAHWKDQFWE
jgi:iron-sulfur cluster repair protein YtfE (RIC family)